MTRLSAHLLRLLKLDSCRNKEFASKEKRAGSALFFFPIPANRYFAPTVKTWSITSSPVAGKLPTVPRAPFSNHILSQ